MFKKITTLLLVVCCIFAGKSQELQFNQWQFAPSLLNPALTGAYQGSFRVGGIVKDKWGSVDNRSWKTMEAYVDAPIIRGIRKSDWIAVGIAFDMDQAGTGKFQQQFQRASVAYHFGFGKKLKSAFTIAGQFTNWAATIDKTKFVTEQGLQGLGETDLDGFMTNMDDELEGKNTRWNGAVGYRSQLSKRNSIGMGLSVSQFLENDRSFLSVGAGDELSVRYLAYISFKAITGKRTSFEPQAVFSKQGVNSKLYLQGIFGYKMENGYTVKYGAGLNAFVNAFNIPLYAGLEKGNLRIGLAYAVDLSELQATSSYGGLEIAASYIHILSKKPEPKPIIVCPRL